MRRDPQIDTNNALRVLADSAQGHFVLAIDVHLLVVFHPHSLKLSRYGYGNGC